MSDLSAVKANGPGTYRPPVDEAPGLMNSSELAILSQAARVLWLHGYKVAAHAVESAWNDQPNHPT